MEEIVDNIMKNIISKHDNMIREAFMSHFGFPIQEVRDTEELEHIVDVGDSIESYRYRGETFLYCGTDSDFRIEETDGCVRVIMTTRFKKV